MKIYAAFHIVTKVNENTKRVYQNHIHEYNNVIYATGTLPIANVDEIMFIPAEYAEVEGIGFLPGNGHDYLLFLTFEGSSRNAGVYRANNIIR